MAIAGALIVFAGLVVLSSIISQLHKVLLFWEKKHPVFKNNDKPEDQEDTPVSPLPKEFPIDLDEIACLYQPLIDEIGETFYLSDLYEIARKGVFSWNPPTENKDNDNG